MQPKLAGKGDPAFGSLSPRGHVSRPLLPTAGKEPGAEDRARQASLQRWKLLVTWAGSYPAVGSRPGSEAHEDRAGLPQPSCPPT